MSRKLLIFVKSCTSNFSTTQQNLMLMYIYAVTEVKANFPFLNEEKRGSCKNPASLVPKCTYFKNLARQYISCKILSGDTFLTKNLEKFCKSCIIPQLVLIIRNRAKAAVFMTRMPRCDCCDHSWLSKWCYDMLTRGKFSEMIERHDLISLGNTGPVPTPWDFLSKFFWSCTKKTFWMQNIRKI